MLILHRPTWHTLVSRCHWLNNWDVLSLQTSAVRQPMPDSVSLSCLSFKCHFPSCQFPNAVCLSAKDFLLLLALLFCRLLLGELEKLLPSVFLHWCLFHGVGSLTERPLFFHTTPQVLWNLPGTPSSDNLSFPLQLHPAAPSGFLIVLSTSIYWNLPLFWPIMMK